MDLIALLILLTIACVVIWAARSIMSAFGIGDPIATVVQVVIIIFVLIALLGQLGYGTGPILHHG